MKNRGFTVYKLLVTIASFVGVIIFKSNINWTELSKNHIDVTLVKEIAYDISISIFTAMIIIWFVDVVSNYIEERISEKKELQAISRIHSVLSQYILRYYSLFYIVVTPLSERNENCDIPASFTMKQMHDLYKSTFSAKNGLSDSAVCLFLQAELELRMQISSLLLSNELNKNISLKDIFVEFLEESLKFDCRPAINDAPKRRINNEKLSEHISNLLIEGDGDQYRLKLQQDDSQRSHVLYPYVMLHDLMENELRILAKYQEVIAGILGHNVPKIRQSL